MFKKLKGKLVSVVRDTRALGASVGGASLVAVNSAMASGGGTTFDSTTILAAIAGMLAAAVLIYTAWTVGKWTVKAFRMLGGG